MAITKNKVYDSLLRFNYFPEQKRDKEELPPCFNSKSFSTTVSDLLCREKLRTGKTTGYDQVEYRVTRYNNVSRPISIPHPKPYAHLVREISNNWDKLKHICNNSNSMVTPKMHSDGRIIIMDYDKKNILKDMSKAFGNTFRVRTDIANFFPSIYTHSIPWALVGFSKAKKNRNSKFWYNRLDAFQRLTKRNETQGIPIGPATSNIISELILSKVDSELAKDFNFHRYVDDYTCYCNCYEDADKFIRHLSQELWRYKLLLNISKTTIESLPITHMQDWILDLYTRLPAVNKIKETLAIRFIDYAVSIQNKTPDGSVLKFAVKSIIGNLHATAQKPVLEYILTLSLHYPILLPLLNRLFDKAAKKGSNFAYKNELKKILDINTINHRSDGMCWALYYMQKFGVAVNKTRAIKVIKTRDCLAITLIYDTGKYDLEALNFIKSINLTDLYEIDQYWILFYQLFYNNKIKNPYSKDKTFDTLKTGGVSFLF